MKKDFRLLMIFMKGQQLKRCLKLTCLLLFAGFLKAFAGNTPLKIINHGDNFNTNEIAKDTVINGTVNSQQSGEPLTGVAIHIKGSQIGTITNQKGAFRLRVPLNSTLEISYIGYKNVEVVVGGQQSFKIMLEPSASVLDQVVVVAYGTQKKVATTAAISSVKGDVLAAAPVANISNSLAGNVAGVSMRPNGGQPGYDNPDLHVRGISTTGNNSPLVVVDGVERNNISQIDPADIASVTILKDAAAVAPYGLGGANGVILITTKRGKTGAPTLTLNSHYGIQQPTYLPKTLSAVDFMKLTNEAYLNDNPGLTSTIPYKTDLINNYSSLHAKDPDLYPSSNAITEIPNKNAPTSQIDMQVSGGTKSVKYFVGAGVLDQKGMFDQTNYRRYSYNINLDVDATPTTKLALSVSGAFENTSSIDASTPILQLFKSLLKYVPIQTLKYTNGDYAGSAGNTPYGLLNSGGYYHKDQTTELMSVSVDQKIPFIPGLSIKGAFSYDPYEYKEKGWHRPYYYYSINTTTNPYTYSQAIATSESYATQTTSLYENYYNNNSFTYQGFLNYHRSFGKSEVTGLVVAEERNNVQSNFGASLNNFQINIDELNFGSSSPTDRGLNGSSSTGSQVGYVYRVDYGYDNKYLFEASGRYDGHYYFAPGHRYAYFPAFSVGWVLSKEKFMKSLSFVNLLKLRASWGKAGNLAGGPFEYLSGYTLYGNSYAFGSGNVVQGSYQAQEANPNLTWEISTKRDIGLEATLWNGLLNIDADYFTERRTGMLLAPSVTVPVEYGLTLAQENAGVMDNHGFELTLQSHHTFRNGLALGLSGNFSYSMNKMVQIYESPSTYDNPNRRLTGRELGEVFGYKAIKLFKTSDDKNNDGIIDSADGYNVTQFGALHPGDVQYADINHDGKIDADDQVPIGDPNYPAITFGFTPTLSWKGVDISVLFQGEAMESFNINGFQTVPFLNNNSNTAYQYYNNRWTPTNQNALYPRATQAPYSNNTQTSSLWIMNTGYIRLKTATLGYTFPSSLLKKSGLSHLRVYVAAQNFLTFSKLKYMDPEIGYTNGELSYPNQKTFIGGLSVSF